MLDVSKHIFRSVRIQTFHYHTNKVLFNPKVYVRDKLRHPVRNRITNQISVPILEELRGQIDD